MYVLLPHYADVTMVIVTLYIIYIVQCTCTKLNVIDTVPNHILTLLPCCNID